MDETLPSEFWQAVEQFNQRQFYACHDTLEALWIEAMAPEKMFYQGFLQIAVALYHLENRNWRGSVILLGEGISRLQTYQPIYAGIHVEQFLIDTAFLLKRLQQAGAENLATILQQLSDPLELSPDENQIGRSNLRFPSIKQSPPSSLSRELITDSM
jgi:predicted metal-dependent hydrolase